MVRKKHNPQRTCIVCRETKNKRDLIRVVRTPAGTVKIDSTGKANGRGAYLCQNPGCWDKGLQQKLLANALKTTLSVTDINMLKTYLRIELSKI